MGRTIIQPIGPLYGEAVNGTVFGRPNGSVYIPETNQISISLSGLYIKNLTGVGSSPYVIGLTNETGTSNEFCTIVARSQDVASNMKLEIAPDTDFAAEDTSYTAATAGQFNLSLVRIGSRNYFEVADGTTYYVRAVLVANSGVTVAVSDIVEVTGVVVE